MDRINEVTKDCFNALMQLRNLGDDSLVQGDMLHARMVGFVDDLYAKAQQHGLPERDAHDIAYAIVALADEIAFRKATVRDVWMSNPLQLRYFNENLAGEGFYQRLDYVLADPSRLEALRVFYTCLLFGFEGKFAMRGGELELTVVKRRCQEALGKMLRPEPLSTAHLRPRERISRTRQGFLTIWLGLFSVLFSLVLVIILRRALDGQTSSLIERIQALLAL
jgi:type VI secretion system protein ImpK